MIVVIMVGASKVAWRWIAMLLFGLLTVGGADGCEGMDAVVGVDFGLCCC